MTESKPPLLSELAESAQPMLRHGRGLVPKGAIGFVRLAARLTVGLAFVSLTACQGGPGGRGSDGSDLATAEIYDPVTNIHGDAGFAGGNVGSASGLCATDRVSCNQ